MNVFGFDFKSFGRELQKFNWQVRDMGYWIQDVHYSEGLRHAYPNHEVHDGLAFIVTSKAKPHLSQAWMVAPSVREELIPKYEMLCDDFIAWEQAGRPVQKHIDEIGYATFTI